MVFAWLVGHALVEFSNLLYHFLQASAESCINVEVTGKRKREVGLVVPAKYNAFTRNKKIAKVLTAELAKRKKQILFRDETSAEKYL